MLEILDKLNAANLCREDIILLVSLFYFAYFYQLKKNNFASIFIDSVFFL